MLREFSKYNKPMFEVMNEMKFFIEDIEVTMDKLVKKLHRSGSQVSKIGELANEALQKFLETKDRSNFDHYSMLSEKYKVAAEKRINSQYKHIDFVVGQQHDGMLNYIELVKKFINFFQLYNFESCCFIVPAGNTWDLSIIIRKKHNYAFFFKEHEQAEEMKDGDFLAYFNLKKHVPVMTLQSVLELPNLKIPELFEKHGSLVSTYKWDFEQAHIALEKDKRDEDYGYDNYTSEDAFRDAFGDAPDAAAGWW